MIVAAVGSITVTFDGSAVTIRRAGLPGVTLVGRGEHTIPIAQISAIQWKDAGRFTLGLFRLSVPGSQASTERTTIARDENAVPFGRKQQPQFEVLRKALQDAISQ